MNELNTQNTARELAALGRGNDSMLMHVTPKEVHGLQSLAMAAGGSLTINPDTGLPEAGFFDFIADYIIPTALTLSGNPQLAVAYSGGKSLIETGDPLQALMAAGMQYGANQFGQSLIKTGTPNPGTSALTRGVEIGKNIATGGGQAVGVAGATGTQSGIAANLVDDVAQSMVPNLSGGTTGIAALPGTPGGAAALPGVNTLVPGASPSLADTFSQNISGLGSGVKTLLSPGGIDAFTTAAGGPASALYQAGSVALPAISALTPIAPPAEEVGYDLGPFTSLEDLRKEYGTMGYAVGGPVSFNDGGFTSTSNSGEVTTLRPLNPMQGVFDARTSMPEFKEPNVGAYKKGGYLDGPGDGMSDSIPATIDNKQPARLADGEFVVPADVVSHLGNGSTKAGAQRLYKMMDRVRKARTGTAKQGKQIKAEKYMPA